jgi:hypothetical protein
MTRHDLLVHTAALRHRPMGWFAPSTAVIPVMPGDLVNIAAADAQIQPGQRPLGGHAMPYVSTLGTRTTTPNRKTP